MDNKTIDKIKNEVDIVNVISSYIDLAKKGRNYWALCPFHEDSNPSMSISPEKQMYKCFVCGAGGGVFNFVSNYEKISFPESVRKVGLTIGVEVKVNQKAEYKYTDSQRDIIAVLKEANVFFKYSLSTKEGMKAKEYLKNRGLSTKIIDDFNIGYAPMKGLKQYLIKKGFDEALIINAGLITENDADFFRDRVIFAISNEHGDVVAFSARDLSGKSNAKYINSPESKLFSKSNTLYNYSNIKEVVKKTKQIYLNEGFMDVIAMTRGGFSNSAAIMGTALTKEHLTLLRGKKVTLMLDSDKAGINATIKSIKLLLENNIETMVVENKSDKDPDEILEAEGVEKLREVVSKEIEAVQFIFDIHKDMYPADSPKNIELFIKSFGKYLAYSSDIEKEFFINKIHILFGISVDIINKNLGVVVKKTPYKKPYVKPQAKPTQVKREVVQERNYSYELILSVLKNSKLAPTFKEKYFSKQILFIDPILMAVSSYIIEASEGKDSKPNKVAKAKVKEIVEYNKFVNSEDEFEELINRVNKESKIIMIGKIKVKLENKDINNKERMSLIKLMAKLKSGR